MSFYEMLKDKPAFKAYCRRRSTQKRKTRDEWWSDLQKKRAAEFRSFCKPRGMLSILKENEYWTGALTDNSEPTVAQLKKQGGEFISVIINPPTVKEPAEASEFTPERLDGDDSATLKLLAAMEQQNALLRQLAARV
jgi:hypothetical protein